MKGLKRSSRLQLSRVKTKMWLHKTKDVEVQHCQAVFCVCWSLLKTRRKETATPVTDRTDGSLLAPSSIDSPQSAATAKKSEVFSLSVSDKSSVDGSLLDDKGNTERGNEDLLFDAIVCEAEKATRRPQDKYRRKRPSKRRRTSKTGTEQCMLCV